MKKLLFLSVLGLVFMGAHAQENLAESTKETPKGSWTVTKEYDEDGNLIAMDSIYSYSWSSSDMVKEGMTQEDLNAFLKSFGAGEMDELIPPAFLNDLKEWSDSLFQEEGAQEFYNREDFNNQDLDSLFNHFRGQIPSDWQNLIPEDFDFEEFSQSFFGDERFEDIRRQLFEGFEQFQNQFLNDGVHPEKRIPKSAEEGENPPKKSTLQKI